MNKNRYTALTIWVAVLMVGFAIQIIQQIYYTHWNTQWSAKFDKAFQIQSEIDKRQAQNTPPEQIIPQQRELRNIMNDISTSFRPNCIPKWLQIGSNFLSVLAIIALWKMSRKKVAVE